MISLFPSTNSERYRAVPTLKRKKLKRKMAELVHEHSSGIGIFPVMVEN